MLPSFLLPMPRQSIFKFSWYESHIGQCFGQLVNKSFWLLRLHTSLNIQKLISTISCSIESYCQTIGQEHSLSYSHSEYCQLKFQAASIWLDNLFPKFPGMNHTLIRFLQSIKKHLMQFYVAEWEEFHKFMFFFCVRSWRLLHNIAFVLDLKQIKNP